MTPMLCGLALKATKEARECLKTFNLSADAAADPNHVGGYMVFPGGSGKKFCLQPNE